MTNLGNFLPEAVSCFNVYKNGTKLIGVSAEVSLAELNAITETVEGAGILGKYETAIAGLFDSIKQEIPFMTLDDDMFTMADPSKSLELTLRSALQGSVKTNGALDHISMRIIFRGRPIAFKPGTLKMGGRMDASVTIECTYILIEMDGDSKFELDKLNSVYKVNGEDLLEKVKRYC